MNRLLSVRALLFTPGNRKERFQKAQETGADGIIIDLEDAISLKEKDQARDTAIQYFKHSPPTRHFLRCLRINSLKTPSGLKDILSMIEHMVFPDALLIPKVESAAEITILDQLLQPHSIPYILLIETAQGLCQSEDIVLSSKNIQAVCFGGGDLAADLGATLSWEAMLHARSQIILSAALARIAAFDVPYLNLNDPNNKGLVDETHRVKALGYTGKLAIHPKHIQPILDVFSPSTEDITQAQRILSAHEQANGNVCELDGKMIDAPIVRSAQRILAIKNHSLS